MDALVCKHFKFGHCKFRLHCRYRHVDVLCEDSSCDINTCEKRHPMICKFYYNYGRCKFSPCSYKHDGTILHTANGGEKMVLSFKNHVTKNMEEINALKNVNLNLLNNMKELKRLYDEVKDKVDRLETAAFNSDASSNLQNPHYDQKPGASNNTATITVSTTAQRTEGMKKMGSVYVQEKDDACCDHYHRLDGDIPPNGSCCYHRCRPQGRRKGNNVRSIPPLL